MKRGLLLSLALPPLVTAIVLIAVAFNRAEALAPIVLTERELSLRPRTDDNSVATLFLQWQHSTGRDSWLDCAKLGTLGIECDVPATQTDAPRHYARMLPRRVFVAFELGGAAWEKLMAERAREIALAPRRDVPVRPPADDDFRERSSRLVAVDADRDAAVLRHRYPDSSRYLVTAAVVHPVLMAPVKEQSYIVGTVNRVDPGELHVPTELAARLPRARVGSYSESRPRYRVFVRYGRRLEPWVTDVVPGEERAPLSLVGEYIVPRPSTTREARPDVGGLSGAWYDPRTHHLLAVSDDHERPRLLTFDVELEPVVRLKPVGLTLLAPPAPGRTLDAEGLAPAPDDRLFVSSEGDAADPGGPLPGIYEYMTDGRFVRALPLPLAYVSDGRGRGMRGNKGIEGLSVSPDRRHLFAALESSLLQDDEETTFEHGAVSRVLVYDLDQGARAPREYAYRADAVSHPAGFGEAKGDNGVADLLALSATELLVLERGYVEERTAVSPRRANTVRLYRVTLDEPADVTGRGSLRQQPPATVLRKTLAFDAATIAPQLDERLRALENFEAMTFGPRLSDGRTSLLLLSDDNFSARQVTAMLVLGLPAR